MSEALQKRFGSTTALPSMSSRCTLGGEIHSGERHLDIYTIYTWRDTLGEGGRGTLGEIHLERYTWRGRERYT
jgi:hypothetical protein